MLDAAKSTIHTSSKQRISKIVRKEAKVQSVLVALHGLAKDVHKYAKTKLGQTTDLYYSSSHFYLV